MQVPNRPVAGSETLGVGATEFPKTLVGLGAMFLQENLEI